MGVTRGHRRRLGNILSVSFKFSGICLDPLPFFILEETVKCPSGNAEWCSPKSAHMNKHLENKHTAWALWGKRASLWSHVMYTYPSLLLFDLFMVFVSSVVEKKNFSPILAFIFRVRAGEWAWVARLLLWGDGWCALLCAEEVYLKRSLMETQGCHSFMWIRAACLSLALGAEVLNVVCLSTAAKAALFEVAPPN